jgi:hypothetical protein
MQDTVHSIRLILLYAEYFRISLVNVSYLNAIHIFRALFMLLYDVSVIKIGVK